MTATNDLARRGRALLVGLGALGILVAPRPAAAEQEEAKVQCKASFESAQVLKQNQRFEAARKQLAICRETCPAPLVRECASWDAELEALLPTIRVTVVDEEGRAIAGARVSVDGRPTTGTLVAVDPGPRVIRVEAAGRVTAERRIDVGVGERERAVSIELRAVAEPSSSPPPDASPSRLPSFLAFGLVADGRAGRPEIRAIEVAFHGEHATRREQRPSESEREEGRQPRR